MPHLLTALFTRTGINQPEAMSQTNDGSALLMRLRQRLKDGQPTLKRMATNLWRLLTNGWLLDSEVYPMTEDAIYAEVIEREGFPPLFLGYCRGEVDCFERVEDLVEFFVEHEAPGDCSVWEYLEPYAESDL
jgi:hypothetical protein